MNASPAFSAHTAESAAQQMNSAKVAASAGLSDSNPLASDRPLVIDTSQARARIAPAALTALIRGLTPTGRMSTKVTTTKIESPAARLVNAAATKAKASVTAIANNGSTAASRPRATARRPSAAAASTRGGVSCRAMLRIACHRCATPLCSAITR
jgi:hypothetical protein